uniref:non-specific serine/threonine protein kinase n=1 Tax=Ignisphaera aggregans TaxID=334771 RepID=A0A7C5YZI5_9CREN
MLSNEIEEMVKKLREDIKKSVSIFQLLIVLEHGIENLENKGLKQSDIETALRSIDILSSQLARLSSCRIDIIDKALRKDPRIKKLNNYTHILVEILHRDCGIQTTAPAVSIPQQRYIALEQKTPSNLCTGRYEIQKLIGEGGMGAVWLAKDIHTNNLVAIKVPKITGNPIKDDLNIKKIMVEAEVLKNLDHPNIVKYIDYFVEFQKPHLVMEYIDGEHLEKKIKTPKDAFDERETIKLMKTLVDAVDYMHSKNVVHRDLKPKNIFIINDSSLNIKVIDFGTAKFYHSQIEYGEGIYSPGGYTAPEQLRFMYSPQSDIWSLGGILFYILTGLHPISILPGYPNVTTPPNIENIKQFKDINQNIAKVIKKALDPNPINRYLRARDMIKDLIGETDLFEKTTKPKIMILDKEIEIEVDRVVIGRLTQTIIETSSKSIDKVVTRIEGNNLYIYINDEKSYISRLHVELIRKENDWYLRDLGSLNKTAVLEGGEWKIIHKQYKIPSELYKLSSRAIISLGYDVKLGPYLVLTFISSPQQQSV